MKVIGKIVIIFVILLVAIWIGSRFFITVEETVIENTAVGEINVIEDNETTNTASGNKETSLEVTPADYVGIWGCGRATINIEKTANFSYDVNIFWGDSAWRSVEWKYACTFDEETGKIRCAGDGTKTVVEYDDNGKETRTVEYKNGKATFEITKEGLIWNDEIENAAEDMVFIK